MLVPSPTLETTRAVLQSRIDDIGTELDRLRTPISELDLRYKNQPSWWRVTINLGCYKRDYTDEEKNLLREHNNIRMQLDPEPIAYA